MSEDGWRRTRGGRVIFEVNSRYQSAAWCRAIQLLEQYAEWQEGRLGTMRDLAGWLRDRGGG